MNPCCGMEIENFILYWTSDDAERKQMLECLNIYLTQVIPNE